MNLFTHVFERQCGDDELLPTCFVSIDSIQVEFMLEDFVCIPR